MPKRKSKNSPGAVKSMSGKDASSPAQAGSRPPGGLFNLQPPVALTRVPGAAATAAALIPLGPLCGCNSPSILLLKANEVARVPELSSDKSFTNRVCCPRPHSVDCYPKKFVQWPCGDLHLPAVLDTEIAFKGLIRGRVTFIESFQQRQSFHCVPSISCSVPFFTGGEDLQVHCTSLGPRSHRL